MSEDNINQEIETKRKRNERKFDSFEDRPDGGRTYIWNRKTPGTDGGHSRIRKIVDVQERTLEVIHEAWRGSQNPQSDLPYHRHTKRITQNEHSEE